MKKLFLIIAILLNGAAVFAYPYEYKHVKTVSEVLAEGLISFSEPEEVEYVTEEYIEPSDDIFFLFEIVNGRLVLRSNYELMLFDNKDE